MYKYSFHSIYLPNLHYKKIANYILKIKNFYYNFIQNIKKHFTVYNFSLGLSILIFSYLFKNYILLNIDTNIDLIINKLFNEYLNIYINLSNEYFSYFISFLSSLSFIGFMDYLFEVFINQEILLDNTGVSTNGESSSLIKPCKTSSGDNNGSEGRIQGSKNNTGSGIVSSSSNNSGVGDLNTASTPSDSGQAGTASQVGLVGAGKITTLNEWKFTGNKDPAVLSSASDIHAKIVLDMTAEEIANDTRDLNKAIIFFSEKLKVRHTSVLEMDKTDLKSDTADSLIKLLQDQSVVCSRFADARITWAKARSINCLEENQVKLHELQSGLPEIRKKYAYKVNTIIKIENKVVQAKEFYSALNEYRNLSFKILNQVDDVVLRDIRTSPIKNSPELKKALNEYAVAKKQFKDNDSYLKMKVGEIIKRN
jgi:hypothetical protein